LPLAETLVLYRIDVSDHPGCCGTAAKLPKKPGIQKLTPSSSASDIVVVDATAARATQAVRTRDQIRDR
jgi:hypothetical protein